MEQKIIICQGLPASGKSTWSKQYCKDNQDFLRINKDDIRDFFYNIPFSYEFEEKIIELERLYAHTIITQGKSLIVDDTNLNKRYVNYWQNFAKKQGIEFEIKTFDTPPEECIKRDLEREKPVGKAVIMDMYKKYIQTDEDKNI